MIGSIRVSPLGRLGDTQKVIIVRDILLEEGTVQTQALDLSGIWQDRESGYDAIESDTHILR
ncbi:hypothetical protein [Bosea sp. Leaf344]|uniref:hypothetical protein n=1 Tax=Bosea sp. Leaf344 TaxID=1736346 RepID=UPI0012E3BA70|nr:hypothetical protein [Bosea sp. Leaf344]